MAEGIAPLGKVKSILAKAFPGIRFTSDVRSRAEQDALVAAGKTRAKNSQHVTVNARAGTVTGLDMVLPAGTKPDDARKVLVDNGINPSEFINETGKGRNQGTAAHLHIGWAPKRGSSPPAPSGSTFDRAVSARESRVDEGPSIAKVFAAYKAGEMSPQEAAQFENDVKTGAVMLPRGAAVNKQPAAFVLPKGVIEAYNSHAMSDEDRAQVDADVRDGAVSLPNGVQLKRPAPRTMGENFGIGARAILGGAADVADVVTAPLNVPINAIANAAGFQGTSNAPFNAAAEGIGDFLGLARPESAEELLSSAVGRGAAGGLVTAGAGVPLAAGRGAVGAVGRALAANPVIDVVSGASGGGASEIARQQGVGPVGQFVAGLAAGGATAGGAMAAERGLARVKPRVAAEVPQAYPREVVFDRAGNLTDEGFEVAARTNSTADDLRAAYEAPPQVRELTANDVGPEVAPAARTADGTPAPEAPAVIEPQPARTAPEVPVAAAIEGAPPVAPEAPLPASATARLAQAQSEGVPLTRGQATQDFATQDAEQTLRAQTSKEGAQARQFDVEQADALKAATERFQEALSPGNATKPERGQLVKDALRDLRDEGQKGVRALYTEAAALPGNKTPLAPDAIVDAADRLIIETPMEQASKDALERALAKFGLLGDKVETSGRYRNIVTDDGRKIPVLGEVTPLSLENAEAFRQALNQARDQRGLMGRAVKALDDTVDEAISGLAGGTERNAAFGKARSAARTQKETFDQKDIVQRLIDMKKGTKTDAILPENAFRDIFGNGNEGTTNLKRIKGVLLSKPTEKSKAAWRAIQAQGVSGIFDQALTINSNLGGGSIGTISGAKLNSAITKFGTNKLKVLLDDADFNQLMKLRRIFGDATIPIRGVTNPSGSGYKLMRFLGPMMTRFSGIPLAGPVLDVVGGLVRQAKDVSEAQRTLKGIAEFTPAEAVKAATNEARADMGAVQKAEEAAREFLSNFIDLSRSDRLITPIITAGTTEEERR